MTPLWYILITLLTLLDALFGYGLCLLKPYAEKRLCFAKKVWHDCHNGLPLVTLEQFSFVESHCHNGLPFA